MTRRESQKVPHGLFIIYWKESKGGGTSVASVGSDATGRRWFAPTNWITVPGFQWNDIDRVERVR